MTEKSKKPNFKDFASKSKETKKIDGEVETSNPLKSSSYRYLQVRITREDSNRLKSAISSKDLSIQSVLIEALNLWMCGYGHPPLSDPGTARDKV